MWIILGSDFGPLGMDQALALIPILPLGLTHRVIHKGWLQEGADNRL
jgi:hypothetical protein